MKYLLLVLTMLAIQAQAGLEIHVFNEAHQPIAGADVLIGSAPNDPFPNNVFKTDANGAVEIPMQWQGALPLTIEASDYISTTFMDTKPEAATFQLHTKDSRDLLEIKGQTSNFQNIKKDGKVDFGLVFQAISQRQLLQFDVNSMISPESDTIRLLTEEIDLPSNITLPEQKETYILPITLKKPVYRMYVKQPGDYKLVAAHAQFPLKEVIKDLQDGKSFYEVLKYFTFIDAGQRDVKVTGSVGGQDIAVNQIPFNTTISVTGPALAGTDVMMSIPMTEQNGLFFPSDIKSVKPGQTIQLRAANMPSQATYVASLMMPASEAQIAVPDQDIAKNLATTLQRLLRPYATAPSEGGLSLSLQPAVPNLVPEFISLISRPVIAGNRISLSKPVAGAGIAPVATYLILAEIEKAPSGSNAPDKRFRLWEVFAEGWVDGIDLPENLTNTQPGKTYRWEVLFLGTDATKSRSLNGYFLDDVTYLSRNSVDFL